MAFKVKNFRFAQNTVYIGNSKVDFDKDGVGEIESKDVYDSLLAMPHFHEFEDKEEVSEKGSEKDSNTDTDEDKKVKFINVDDGPVVNDKIVDESGNTHDARVVETEDPKAEEILKNGELDKDKAPSLVSSDNLGHKELDAKAQELGIDVSGTKTEKAKQINDYIIANF